MGGHWSVWINFPICTNGAYNCREKVCPPGDTDLHVDVGSVLAADIVGAALGKIIGGLRAFAQFPAVRMQSKQCLLRHMACFLIKDMLQELDQRIAALSQAGDAATQGSQPEVPVSSQAPPVHEPPQKTLPRKRSYLAREWVNLCFTRCSMRRRLRGDPS